MSLSTALRAINPLDTKKSDNIVDFPSLPKDVKETLAEKVKNALEGQGVNFDIREGKRVTAKLHDGLNTMVVGEGVEIFNDLHEEPVFMITKYKSKVLQSLKNDKRAEVAEFLNANAEAVGAYKICDISRAEVTAPENMDVVLKEKGFEQSAVVMRRVLKEQPEEKSTIYMNANLETEEGKAYGIRFNIKDGDEVARASLYILDDKTGFVEDVYVDCSQQGNGYGNKVMDALMSTAHELGLDQVILTSKFGSEDKPSDYDENMTDVEYNEFVRSWYERKYGFENHYSNEFRRDPIYS